MRLFSQTVLHILPFLWQKTVRCKMLSLWCSFVDFSIWHFPYVFLDTCANSFIFTTEDVRWMMALIQCSSWRLVSGPYAFIPTLQHASIIMTEDGSWKTLTMLFLLRVTSMAVSLRFNTHIGKPWCLQWSTLPSLCTNLIHWMEWWHFLFVFTQHFWSASSFFGNFVWKF